MKIYYIANSRIPTEKAHGIQIAQMLKAFANFQFPPPAGGSNFQTNSIRQLADKISNSKPEIELIIPRRFNKIKEDIFDYYGIEKVFKVTKLPCLDLIPLGIPKIGFWIQAVSFGFAAAVYLLIKSKPEDIIYSRDEFSLWFLSFFGRNLFWEAHTFPGSPQKYHRILKKINGLVAISHGLKKSFQAVGMAEEKILVAPDAVDLARFAVKESSQECRKKLSLPQDKKIVLYTGHLYKWKGADVLMESSEFLSENTLVYLVGGTEEDVASYKPSSRAQAEGLKAESYKLVTFVGHRSHKEIPYWLKAADVLVLPNSAKEKISAIYTSPLKLFEYMAGGKPIVASDLPSLREILNENTAVLVEPYNPEALAKGIEKVLKDGVLAGKIAQNAAEEAKNYTWEKRAQNILTFLSNKAIIK